MRWLRHLLFIPPFLAGAGLIYLAISGREPPARVAAEERAIPVSYIVVEGQTVAPHIRGFGNVEPGRRFHVVPQVSGRVAEINPTFARGGTLAEDEWLLRIAPEDFELAIARAEAGLAAARVAVDELDVTATNLEESLAIERQALAVFERELERQRTLAQRGTVGEARIDEQTRAVLGQRQRIQDLANQARLIPVQREAMLQEIASAEASLAADRLDLERTELRAPFAGRVASADVEESQFVAAGVSLGIIDGIAEAEIEAQFPGSIMRDFVALALVDQARVEAASRFRPDQLGNIIEANVSLDVAGVEARWQARVKSISDQMDAETRSFGLIVTVDNPYGQAIPGIKPPLIKGMFVTVELHAAGMPGQIIIPRAMIQSGQVLLLNDDDRLELRSIEIMAVLDDVAFVAGGLEPGERLVTSQPEPAIEGMLTRPVLDGQGAAWLESLMRP